MNIQETLAKKKQELQDIKTTLQEEIFYSQIKYLQYKEQKNKLKNEILHLENIITNKENGTKKIWIDIGDGWKQRTYKKA